MRFLSMIRIDENSGLVPSGQLMTDMGKLIEELKREGALINTAGLRPTAEGARVRLRRGKLSTTDGPFIRFKLTGRPNFLGPGRLFHDHSPGI